MPAPANPAPASGPGAMSKRTDTGPAQKLRDLPDAQYGEAKTFRDLQTSAPLAQTPPPAATAGNATGNATGTTPSVIPLNAPTTRPDEPITTGSQFGPGAGPEALGGAATPQQAGLSSAKAVLQSVASASGSQEASALLNMLSSRM